MKPDYKVYDESVCGEPDPDAEYECQHTCTKAKGHWDRHSVTYSWKNEDDV